MLYFLTKKNTQKLYRLYKSKKIKKIYRWIYSDELQKDEKQIFLENIERILYKLYFVWEWNQYCQINEMWQLVNTWTYQIWDLSQNTKNFYICWISSLYWVYNDTYYIRSNVNFTKEIYWITIISKKASLKQHSNNLEKYWITYKTNLETSLLDICKENYKDTDIIKIIQEKWQEINKEKMKTIKKTRKIVYSRFHKIYKSLFSSEDTKKEKQDIIVFNNTKYTKKIEILNTIIDCFQWENLSTKFQWYFAKFDTDEDKKTTMKNLYLLTYKYFNEYYLQKMWKWLDKEEFWNAIKEDKNTDYNAILRLEKLYLLKSSIFKLKSSDQFVKYYDWIYKSLYKNKSQLDHEYLKEMYQVLINRELTWLDKLLWIYLILIFDDSIQQNDKKIFLKLYLDLQSYNEYDYQFIDLSLFYKKEWLFFEFEDINTLTLNELQKEINNFLF